MKKDFPDMPEFLERKPLSNIPSSGSGANRGAIIEPKKVLPDLSAKNKVALPKPKAKKAKPKTEAKPKVAPKVKPKAKVEAKKVPSLRAAAEESASKGKLPTPPDFSANTHKPHRKRLAEVVALAKKGDIKALKAYQIKAYSSSPKAIDRYRNLCVIALTARR